MAAQPASLPLPPVEPSEAVPDASFAVIEGRIRGHCARLGREPQALLRTRLLLHVSRQVEARLEACLAPHGLNDVAWTVLMALHNAPEKTFNPSWLSAVLMVPRVRVTRVAEFLVGSGLVLRRPCAEDRRRVLLSLTERGRALIEQVLPRVMDEYEAMIGALPAGLQADLENDLRGLLAHLETTRPSATPCDPTTDCAPGRSA